MDNIKHSFKRSLATGYHWGSEFIGALQDHSHSCIVVLSKTNAP